MDVGNLPNHVKYCLSVLYPPMSNYQYTPGPRMGVPEFPNTAIMAMATCSRITNPDLFSLAKNLKNGKTKTLDAVSISDVCYRVPSLINNSFY